MVLSHEISHHIDSADFPAAYKEYHSCFTKNYGKVLNIKPGQRCFETSAPCEETFKKNMMPLLINVPKKKKV